MSVALEEPQLTENNDCNNCLKLVNSIKEKLTDCSKEKKVQMLTLVPDDWTIQKTVDFFSVSQHVVKQARKLKKEKGILATPSGYFREGLGKETKDLVISFYERDDISRICPGKKDSITVRMADGSKEKVQKRLLLANIAETYANFKSEFPTLKIGFSTFALLRPKWCMTVGVAGSHNVCVCTYHQNVKLMLHAVNPSLNYKDVLKLCVCSTENADCMLHHCDECPEQTVIQNFLKEQLLLNYMIDDSIKYKQWVSTDRSNLEDHEDDFDDFLEKLSSKFFELTEHHFISKKQSEFLRIKKSNLNFDEAVLILDFAENYSFIVQDCAQGFHWNNVQATIHPFVLYYLNSETKELNNASFSCISDHMTHNAVTVYAFLKALINEQIKTRYPFIKSISYFTDGSPAQYKNFKNFTNLIMHEQDFGIKAEWHFFATSHGKNACDGVGGTIKRLAARASLQRAIDNQILNPHHLYDYAKSEIAGITCFLLIRRKLKLFQIFCQKDLKMPKNSEDQEKITSLFLKVITFKCPEFQEATSQ